MGIRLERGFALVLALIALVGVSLFALVAVEKASFEQRRERERELLFVGEQFRQAIDSYAAAGGSGVGALPKTLDDLVLDKRVPATRRHLRRIYADPMTGKPDWVLEKNQDRIVGVHSRSTLAPIRHSNFPDGLDRFARAKTYQDWRFVPDTLLAAAAPIPPGASPGDPASGTTGSNNENGNPQVQPQQAGNVDAALASCAALYANAPSQCYAQHMPQGELQNCLNAARAANSQCVQSAYQQ